MIEKTNHLKNVLELLIESLKEMETLQIEEKFRFHLQLSDTLVKQALWNMFLIEKTLEHKEAKTLSVPIETTVIMKTTMKGGSHA